MSTTKAAKYKLLLEFLAYLESSHVDLVAPTTDGEGGYQTLDEGQRITLLEQYLNK